MLWTWGGSALTQNGRVRCSVASPWSCLCNLHSKKLRNLSKPDQHHKYFEAFRGNECNRPRLFFDFFLLLSFSYTVINCKRCNLSQMYAHVRVNKVFQLLVNILISLMGSTVSCFCLCHTRSQLYYQHGTSAWHRMSWWHNEIKEVSHTCSHCVLDVWKCLLCNFCNLGERVYFKDTVVPRIHHRG